MLTSVNEFRDCRTPDLSTSTDSQSSKHRRTYRRISRSLPMLLLPRCVMTLRQCLIGQVPCRRHEQNGIAVTLGAAGLHGLRRGFCWSGGITMRNGIDKPVTGS